MFPSPARWRSRPVNSVVSGLALRFWVKSPVIDMSAFARTGVVPGAIAAPVVEAQPGLVLGRPDEELRLPRAEQVDAALQRDEQSARAPQRDAARRLGHRHHGHVRAVVALERPAVDVDPPQRMHALVPDRAFAELVARVEHPLRGFSHAAE